MINFYMIIADIIGALFIIAKLAIPILVVIALILLIKKLAKKG